MNRWKLASQVYHEAIFQGQLTAAGSNAARLTEKLASKSDYIGTQGRMVQIFGSFYLLTVALLSLLSFIELRSVGEPGTHAEWTMLVASGSVALQLLIQGGYLVMLTILATAEILAPDLYRWFESLPLSSRDLGSLKVLALAREFGLPLGVIVISTPLVVGLAGGSLAGGLVGILVSIVHAVAILAVVVISSWRMRRVLRSGDGDDRGARTARVVTMVAYGVGTLLVVFIMQIGTNVLARLFETPLVDPAASTRILNVLALLPLPTAPAVLLVTIAGSATPHAALVFGVISPWMPIVGTFLYAATALGLGWKAFQLVGRDRASAEDTAREPVGRPTESRDNRASHTLSARPLVLRSPRRAFARQIGRAASRDTQVLITIIFPVVLPLLAAIGPLLSGSDIVVSATMGLVIAGTGGGWMVIHGLTRLQFGSGGLEASLPVRERDRVFPRLILASVLPTLGALLAALVVRAFGDRAPEGILVEAIAVCVVVPAGMLVKVALFGRVGTGVDRFVLDEIRTNARFWKWSAVVGTLALLTGSLLAGHRYLFAAIGTTAHAALLGFTAIVVAAEIAISRRLFR